MGLIVGVFCSEWCRGKVLATPASWVFLSVKLGELTGVIISAVGAGIGSANCVEIIWYVSVVVLGVRLSGDLADVIGESSVKSLYKIVVFGLLGCCELVSVAVDSRVLLSVCFIRFSKNRTK